MKRKKIQYNEISEEIYSPEEISKAKIIILCIVLLLVGFFLNFNFQERVNAILKPILLSNQNCPIQYDQSDFQFFRPKFILKNPIIMGQCFGQYGQRLPLKELSIALNGPSFVPPGIELKIEAKQGKTNLKIYPSLSFGKTVILFKEKESTIDLSMLGVLFQEGKSPFNGTVNLDGVIHLADNKISEGRINLTSKNLVLPEQNIKGFLAPNMNLKTFALKLLITNGKDVRISEFKLGNGNPMGLNLKGSLALNQARLPSSQIRLDGRFQTTPFLLENFALLKLLLPPEPNPDGLFKFNLQGELGSLPQPVLSNP